MQIFYAPDIETVHELPEGESQHCVRVLRMKEGDEIGIIDGRGNRYRAEIVLAHPKRCGVRLLEKEAAPNPWTARVHVAIAPTKNLDRIEWFAEKTTEIGIDAITLLRCRFSERKELKTERLNKILVSAMKQSLKAVLPQLSEMTPFAEFVARPFDGQKFIAHCYDEGDRKELTELYRPGENALILIGPEGDFSPEEVEQAIACGFRPVMLGPSRLRTETAGLVACHTIQLMNQLRIVLLKNMKYYKIYTKIIENQ